ncbi:MAG: thioredoxin [Candidatus Aenigmarchaeota archaeon]|nr:thioredoxin [Candidatus Aenigmarchaeota archaeon]
MLIHVNDFNFKEEVLERSKKIPVVVDFFATWCGPCQMLGPIMEKIAEKYDGKIVVAKLNVNEGRLAAQAYGVMGIPSVKMFKNGKIVAEFVGYIPEDKVAEWVDKNV